MFKLVIQDDEGKTTVVPLIRDEITIGRKEGNTIRLTERNVSRRHARILRNNGEVQIEDLGSYNGIRVNNARIAERVSLRVSDQVQIGDYKLYLKAEGGVEQVDDARTMPIERVDSAMNTAPTDVIPTVATPPPTQPMAVATPVPGRQLVGDPNRTLVSVADTDPQGRPVASAAAVAALTSAVGYGKLVVLSSNFAGKEFELSRPQMIIGRTDENDIVVNHRSISRNHAKLVREPDTGRYTISDLQSSNGVRVNGQDYGKVELRRGDVVDLGHVRLRFVEPGEDFVFARDAVITDVPDVGGKRGLMIAVLVGVVVVVAIVAVVMMRGGKPNNTTNGSQLDGSDAGPIVATIEDANVVVPPPPEIDAALAKPTTNDDAARLKVDCLDFQSREKWDDLLDCSLRLAKLDDKVAQPLKAAANREITAGAHRTKFDEALNPNTKDIKKAKIELDAIQGSIYYDRYKQRYEAAEKASVDELVRLLRAKANGNCRDWNVLWKQEVDARGKKIVEEAKRQAPCKTVAAVDPCKENPNGPGCGGAVTPPPPQCDSAELMKQGTDVYASGAYSQALAIFEKAFNCKNETGAALRAFMSACKIANKSKAKYYYKRAPTQAEQALSICVGAGINKDELLGP